MRLLDLFCGRWGWSAIFAARGWDCVGVDLVTFPSPEHATLLALDVLTLTAEWIQRDAFDFIVASSPCEEFSIHGMKHFHPHPKYPETGVKLFNHTRAICEASGVPYVMENVRPAQQFVGRAVHHCGPFYLWGNAVPMLMPQGVTKGMDLGSTRILKSMTIEERRALRRTIPLLSSSSGSATRKALTAQNATIPPILASAIAQNAELILADKARAMIGA